MKVSKEKSQQNKVEILNAASVIIRRDGLSAASIASIAQHAELTHGAIYRHFASKEVLAIAVIEHDFKRIVELIVRLKMEGAAASTYSGAYLAADHRDYFVWGCPVGALVSEMHRHPLEVGAAFTEGLIANIDALASLLGKSSENDQENKSKSVAILALMAGALSMARAVKAHNSDLSAFIMTAALGQIEQL